MVRSDVTSSFAQPTAHILEVFRSFMEIQRKKQMCALALKHFAGIIDFWCEHHFSQR